MRVLQLGPFARPHGGVQANLVAIRDFLLRRDIACPVVNLTRFRETESGDVYYPKNAFELLWRLLTLKYDVAHVHIGGDLSLRLAGLGVVCSLIPGRKTILTFHSGGYPSSEAARAAGPRTLRGFAVRRFDRLIAVNQEIADFFCRLGYPRDRTRLIAPHAIPALEGAAGGANDATALPEPLRAFWQSHDPVLVTVGQLESEYDLPLQIDALGAIRDVHPRAGLAIVGAGGLERELRSRVNAAPYGEHVLLCGDVPRDATLRAVAQSRALLRTTRYDGDSIAVREALHVGTPVIATDNHMRPAGVRLIPIGSRIALERAVLDVLAQPPNATRAYEADEHNLEAVLEVYRELTA